MLKLQIRQDYSIMFDNRQSENIYMKKLHICCKKFKEEITTSFILFIKQSYFGALTQTIPLKLILRDPP